MRHVTVTELKILEALAEFQYLTTSQFLRLGILQTATSLYPHINRLTKEHNPKIGRVHYAVSPAKGRQESTVFLTKHGAKRLLEAGYDIEQIKFPKSDTVSFATDYLHRLWTVDFFVSLKNWALESEYDLTDFYYYFQQTGSNRSNKGGRSLSDNRLDIDLEGIRYVIPDGVAIVEREHTTPVFIFFEQHNGKDTKRFLRQVHGHCVALREGLASIKYNVKFNGEYVANRVFCAFEHEACMLASMSRLAKSPDFQPYIDYFYFRTTESINEGKFDEGWQLANKKPVGV